MSRTPKPKDANRTATEAAAAGMAADIEAPTEPYVRRAAGRAPGFDRVMSGADRVARPHGWHPAYAVGSSTHASRQG